MLPLPLAPLAAWPQFVAWRLEPKPGTDKPTKVPYSPIHGRKASSTEPADWGTYEQAAAMPGMAGIGFVFTAADPFWFLDIDGALVDGKWSMLAQELLARLPGCMVEVSQSGTGLHVIGSASAPPVHRNKNIPLKIELYSKERFVALTGLQASGSVTTQADGALAAIIAQFFDPTATVGAVASEWTTAPAEGWSGPTDDFELLERIFNSAGRSAGAAFGGGITFVDLWEANTDALAAKWPDPVQGRGFDHTNADQSMANTLAFWTGRDCARIERLMRMSSLFRSKWDEHGTYLQNTILKAIGLVQNVYVQDAPRQPPTPTPPPPPQELEAAGFKPRLNAAPIMLSGAQLDHFKGCVYITGLNKVLTPNGDLLDQARFNVLYGGHAFTFTVDGKTTTSAWQALTENQAYETAIADRLCFRPEHGAGGVIVDSGKRLANAYIPAETEETEGNPAPFLNHVAKMLPNGRDAEILLTYMASVKQNPGMKAQWWPVVQGMQGNGKSSLLSVMSFAVGSHYSHTPNTEKMIRNGSNFNGWIERKLFLGLDEIHGANRREFFHGFKTTVTNLTLPIEGKGIEEVTGDNRANGMIVVNDQDGVPITDADRRYAALFCAQQSKEDMKRDGMTDAYFSAFYDWLKGRGTQADKGVDYGLRVINHYLARKALAADLDPNQLAIHAPVTTSTSQALLSGRGRAEQEVAEAIDEDRPGFSGGWVSSIKLNEFLEQKRITIPLNKRRDLMLSLGYDWHPALASTGGRTNNVVGPDNGKPRLFCKVGSISWSNLTTNVEVGKAYSDAQLKASSDKSAAGQAFR